MITSNTIVCVLLVSIGFISSANAGEKNIEKPSFMPYHKREAIKRRIEGKAADQIRTQYNVGPEEIKGIIPHTNVNKDKIENLCGANHPALLLAKAVKSAEIGYSVKESKDNSLVVKCHILLPLYVDPKETTCSRKHLDWGDCYNYCQNSYNRYDGF